MSKPSNPTLIGAFVLGALALVTLATLLFGGAELFTRKQLLVSYFPDSVKGLREGANVLLSGVRVGYVKTIELRGRIQPDGSLQTLVEVLMEVQPEKFRLTRDVDADSQTKSPRLSPQQFVKAGIRAKLGIDSFVTGQLVVEFDFQPTIEAVYRGGTQSRYPEVPTIPSDVSRVLEQLQQFFQKLSGQVDFEQLFKDIQGIASGLDQLANSSDLRGTIAGTSRLTNVDIPKLASSVEASLAELRSAVADTRALLRHVDSNVDPMARDLTAVLRRLDATLANAQSTLRSTSEHLQDDSQLSVDVRATMNELQAVSRSARVLLDYLDQHPEALLRGKREKQP